MEFPPETGTEVEETIMVTPQSMTSVDLNMTMTMNMKMDMDMTSDMSDWTETKKTLYIRTLEVIYSFELQQIAHGGTNERRNEILRQIYSEKIREVFCLASWDELTLSWLHSQLKSTLEDRFFTCYLDLLQSLQPHLIKSSYSLFLSKSNLM